MRCCFKLKSIYTISILDRKWTVGGKKITKLEYACFNALTELTFNQCCALELHPGKDVKYIFPYFLNYFVSLKNKLKTGTRCRLLSSVNVPGGNDKEKGILLLIIIYGVSVISRPLLH